jgi:endosialidase-like protein
VAYFLRRFFEPFSSFVDQNAVASCVRANARGCTSVFAEGDIMLNKIAGLMAFLLTSMGVVVAAEAACTVPYPNFISGTTADASQMNGNFASLVGCVAPLASPSFTGNVGIAVTTPVAKLDISAGTLDGVRISNSSSIAGSGLVINNTTFGGTDATAFSIVQRNSGVTSLFNNNVSALSVDTGGNVGIGTTAPAYTLYVNGSAAGPSGFQTVSDVRLKKNIVPVSGGLELISQMQPVRFDFRPEHEREVGKELKLPLSRQIGFIAQDVAKILPEATATAKDNDAIMSVTEPKIIPVLVAAVKELKAANDNQAAQIERLEGQGAVLQRKLGLQSALK